jgi:hypothetical protein
MSLAADSSQELPVKLVHCKTEKTRKNNYTYLVSLNLSTQSSNKKIKNAGLIALSEIEFEFYLADLL